MVIDRRSLRLENEMSTIKYFSGATEVLWPHGMKNEQFVVQFPGVKGKRYDGFMRLVGHGPDGKSVLPIDRVVEYKSNPSKHKCDSRCMHAQGKIMRCECSCGGVNHGLGGLFS